MNRDHRPRSWQAALLAPALCALGCGSEDPSDTATGGAGTGGGGSGGSGTGGSGGVWFEERLLPFAVGNSWTYRVTEAGVVSTKVTTIEAEEPVGGSGPNQDVLAMRVRTVKGTNGNDETVSWQADLGNMIVRYREQAFGAQSGELELEEHWGPYKLRIDERPEHLVEDTNWVEEYDETKLPVGLEAVTHTAFDLWTVLPRERLEVEAGSFDVFVVERSGGSTLKTYYFAPGVGKIKETGGQTEELVSYEVAP